MAAPPGPQPLPRDLLLLGATGALGGLALAEALAHPTRLRVTALAAGRRGEELAALALAVAQTWGRLPALAVADGASAEALRARLRAAGASEPRIHVGPAGLARIVGPDAAPAEGAPAPLVICAIGGLEAWPAVEAAAAAGRSLVVSSKEVLVVAGEALGALARARGGTLEPLDSELSAAATLLARAGGRAAGSRLLLTASGGPLWERPAADLAGVRPAEVLHHPVWPLGPKIAVDSATQINKAHEVVAAAQLFGIPGDRIHVAIHPAARIHAALGLPDGSELALEAPPDMRLPLRGLLGSGSDGAAGSPSWGRALAVPGAPPALGRDGGPDGWRLGEQYPLFSPDLERFPGILLGHAALAAGAGGRATLAGADEAAVAAFLAGRLPFPGIAATLARALAEAPACGEDLPALREAASAARRKWAQLLGIEP